MKKSDWHSGFVNAMKLELPIDEAEHERDDAIKRLKAAEAEIARLRADN